MLQARNRVRAFDAIIAFGFALAALAQPADALSTAAEAEGRAIREAATTIRQTEEQARGLKTQIDEVLRNLERPGAQARSNVPGWERC